MDTLEEQARAFLMGKALTFEEADALWTALKKKDGIPLARAVLQRLRRGEGLLDQPLLSRATRDKLCEQEALLTSKDAELNMAVRHDRALRILTEHFGDLGTEQLSAETLGIAGGIYKRRWSDLGQVEDLRRAARCYDRGANADLGEDAYAHINAAFLDDLLASIGDDPPRRRQRAEALRERILRDLPNAQSVSARSRWFNIATRAEALFGLRRYKEAAEVVATAQQRADRWELESTARQISMLAHMHHQRPLEVPDIHAFFDALLPGASAAARSAALGKVGLALSGGGFRASFYHLGVLARLAELDVLRHVEVLSCVSGGSIVGTCYWMALRRRLMESRPMRRQDYVELVQRLIEHFTQAVATDLRGSAQPSPGKLLLNLWKGQKGAMDTEDVARALAADFYLPLMPDVDPLYMHDLKFTPADHDAQFFGSEAFHPGRHNWLRAHKVPVLVINATTVNTAHAWQFTPTWMGESPWAVHESADSIPRLEWSWYVPDKGWQIEVARAVAASACVPGLFAPLQLHGSYDGVKVSLVDGGVHDNQGTVSLLALDCNVLLVSDACGQLMLEKQPEEGLRGQLALAQRSMDILMERVRLANFADLEARKRTGLLRGLMFLHMKAGLDANTIPLDFSQQSSQVQREKLSPAGIRKDFQKALSELRTDLNVFSPHESRALMACGYQMALWAFQRDLAALTELWEPATGEAWAFSDMLQEITSTAESTQRREPLLAELQEGRKVRL